MTITLLRRRALRSFRIKRPPCPPNDGILVVEHEFEGGPFHGRRMTGLASTVDIHVVLTEPGSRPRLVARAMQRAPIGSYRFERMYDCSRRVERVHVYRWCPSNSTDDD
jgi:hypothetical protein